MNRTLKRPMFRIGGSAGTGITSGLDQPKKMANGDKNVMMAGFGPDKQVIREMMRDRLSEEMFNKDYDDLTPDEMETIEIYLEMELSKKETPQDMQMAANGGRIGYQQGTMPNFQMSGLPGFATSFGLNLLATPPQGNIFQTAAVAAKDPFDRLQASQAAARKTGMERDFLRSEREASDESAMDRLKLKIESDERIAGMKSDDALYNVMLEQYIENDLPPQAAERAALFSTTKADELRGAVSGRYGGVLQFDIRDPSNQKQVRKNLDGKVVYDPYEDNYKYIVVRDGEVFFDEFDSIAEIKFPEINVTKQKKMKPAPDVFSPKVEDVTGA